MAKKIEFTDKQKNGIIYFLKERFKSISVHIPTNDVQWNNFHVKPLISARLKLEDEKVNFTKNEILSMSSCINEHAPKEKFIDASNHEKERILEPFDEALMKLKMKL